MPNEPISEMVGNHKLFNMKENPIDHSSFKPAGMAQGMRTAAHEVAETLMPKRKP